MTITAEQRAARKLALGASDITAVLGLDEYRTPYDVWLEKTGKLVDFDLAEKNQAVRIGNALENYVLDLFEEEMSEIVRAPATISDPSLFLSANLDAMTVADGYPVEAKTAGMCSFIKDVWGPALSDIVPDQYIFQTHQQMMLAKKSRAYIPALLGGRGFFVYMIQRNEQICEQIAQLAHEFWTKFVLTDTPPDNSLPSLEVIKRHRRTPAKTVAIDEELVAAVVKATEDKKEAEEAEEQAKAALLAAMGDAECATSLVGSVTYLEQGRAGVDIKALKTEYPDIAKKFATLSRFRVMRTKSK